MAEQPEIVAAPEPEIVKTVPRELKKPRKRGKIKDENCKIILVRCITGVKKLKAKPSQNTEKLTGIGLPALNIQGFWSQF